MPDPLHAIALVSVHNEEPFIASCLESLLAQGLAIYLLDHGSTDRTGEIASGFLGRGLLGIEPFPRGDGVFRLDRVLERKVELSRTLDADWFLHADADEIRLPPRGHESLLETIEDAERLGCNVINFEELTFLPTVEAPDHHHPKFAETMRWYYAFGPRPNYRMNLWKRFDGPLGLVASRGHHIERPGLSVYPRSGRLKHYPVLSVPHAIAKYQPRKHDPDAVARGFHGWRARLAVPTTSQRPDLLVLPNAGELRETRGDDDLDTSAPEPTHVWLEAWAERVAREESLRTARGT